MSEQLKVSSYQSLGAVDGPSLRTVVFLHGCPLRCMYCHNPETWTGKDIQEYTPEDLAKKVLRNKPYFKDGGGITVSGGEPLLQQKGIISLFETLKEQDIHTCVDTSASEAVLPRLMELTDLFLIDVKFLSGEEYLKYVKNDIYDSMVAMLHQTKETKTPIWIRHVMVPDVTANKEYIGRLLDFLQEFDNIERIDLLPYKSLCTTKYENLKLEFPMAGVKESPPALVKELKAMVPPHLRGKDETSQ